MGKFPESYTDPSSFLDKSADVSGTCLHFYSQRTSPSKKLGSKVEGAG